MVFLSSFPPRPFWERDIFLIFSHLADKGFALWLPSPDVADAGSILFPAVSAAAAAGSSQKL